MIIGQLKLLVLSLKTNPNVIGFLLIMLHMVYEHHYESKPLTFINHHKLGGHSEIVTEYLKCLGMPI